MKRSTKAESITRAIKSLLAEKRAVSVMEQGLVKGLNRVLRKIGYQAVPASSGTSSGRKRRRRRARKPGRPRGRRRVVKARKARVVRKRRRGRPRKSR